MSRRVQRKPIPPRTLAEVLEAMPHLRQSTMGQFDSCRLSALFDLEGYPFTTAEQARGIIYHRFAGKLLRTLWETGNTTMPVGEALQILYEACAQRDVPDRDLVWVPTSERRLLRVAAIMTVFNPVERALRPFGVDKLIPDGIELRLHAPVRYPESRPCSHCHGAKVEMRVEVEWPADAPVRAETSDCSWCGGWGRELTGATIERSITGQLDAILADPGRGDEPDGVVVLDFKTTRVAPPKYQGEHRDERGRVDGSKVDAGLSYLGYWQQRTYGFLVLRNMPPVQRVTLREVYPLDTDERGNMAVRTSTIVRDDMEAIEQELGLVAELLDRGLMGGSDSEVWDAQPGVHCLGGETRILTSAGIRTLRDCVGESVEVLDRHGEWVEAIVRSFGTQRLLRVTFDDGSVVRATPDHRWWTMEQRNRGGSWRQTNQRVTTVEVEHVPVARHATLPAVSEEGVRHGFTYGDGWLRMDRGTCVARIMPHDVDVAWYFERVRWRPNGQGWAYGLPAHYKTLPTKATPAYARGFIAGLHAADGTVDVHGGVLIYCEGRERAEQIAEIARLGGCVVSSVLLNSGKPTNYSAVGTLTRELMAIRIKPATAPVLKGYHRARLRVVNQMRSMRRTVVAVEEDSLEEVFCAVVPGSESFTLANGVVTSNCRFCRSPSRCPIEPEARREGRITSKAEAARVGAEAIVAQQVLDYSKKAMKPHVEVYGPIDVKWAKGRQQWRFDPPKSGKGRGTFGVFVPAASDRGPEDPAVAGAFAEVKERKRSAA